MRLVTTLIVHFAVIDQKRHMRRIGNMVKTKKHEFGKALPNSADENKKVVR